MARMLALAALAFVAAGSPASAGNAVVERAIDGFVRPGYAAFAARSGELRADMDALCAEPGPAALEAARRAFGEEVAAWSRVEPLRFGPVTEQNRLERILYWPDRKSIGLKQVQRALAEEDPSVTDPAALAGKSVAVQGLGALEYVLFGTDADQLAGNSAAHRCAFGLAVAGNLSSMAAAIDAEWAEPDGFARTWSTPGPDNALYRTDAEALTELVDVFIHGLEQIRDVRLKGFLGAAPQDDKPKQAVFWRSGLTVASLAGNIAGLRDLFAASGLREAMSADNRWIADSISAQFANAGQVLDGVPGPVEDSLKVAERRAQLDYFGTITSGLTAAFAMRLAPDLGLSAGFSSLDGD